MAHRSARGALRERRDVILERLGILEVKDDADEERGALLNELDGVRRSLELITPPRTVLKRLRIVRGCDVSWESMVGDARVRHCGACDREVYDLTAMDPDEVEDFVEARRENLPCVRMHARPDGRYQDGPCAPAQRRHFTRAIAAAAALGLAGVLGTLGGEGDATGTCASSTSASDHASSNHVDGGAFTNATPNPSLPDSARRWGRGALSADTLGEPTVCVREAPPELEDLEPTFWSNEAVVRAAAGAAPGYVTLTVTVDTRGRLSADVLYASEGLEEIAARVARAAPHVRAPFRPTEPITTHWYHAFR